jgi:hypothetical protein
LSGGSGFPRKRESKLERIDQMKFSTETTAGFDKRLTDKGKKGKNEPIDQWRS